MTQEIDPNRRRLLNLAGWAAAAAAGGGVALGGERATMAGWTVLQDWFRGYKDRDIGESYNSLLGGRQPDAVSIGEGNFFGKSGSSISEASIYIKRAATALNDGICSAFRDYGPEVCSEARLEDFDNIGRGIFIGGPYSNKKTAAFLGYDMTTLSAGGQPIATASEKTRLPFVLDCGEGELGRFGGKVYLANRTVHVNGECVVQERPLYRLTDRAVGKSYQMETSNGWLASDYFQVIRARDLMGNLKLFFWGMTGLSLDGFFDDRYEKENLARLVDLSEGMDQFQLVLPMKVSFEKTVEGDRMAARADWDMVRKGSFLRELFVR